MGVRSLKMELQALRRLRSYSFPFGITPECDLRFVFGRAPSLRSGSGCCGVRRAPSRLRRDPPFGRPSASLTPSASFQPTSWMRTGAYPQRTRRLIPLYIRLASQLLAGIPRGTKIDPSQNELWYHRQIIPSEVRVLQAIKKLPAGMNTQSIINPRPHTPRQW